MNDPDLHGRRTVEIVYVLLTSVSIVAVPLALASGAMRLLGVSPDGTSRTVAMAALGLLVLGVTIRAVHALRAFELRLSREAASPPPHASSSDASG